MLSVEGASKSFGDTQAVRYVSFRVEEAQIFVLLDANGAGKTTTVRMIPGASRGSARPSPG